MRGRLMRLLLLGIATFVLDLQAAALDIMR
jgi:hypothetical protein